MYVHTVRDALVADTSRRVATQLVCELQLHKSTLVFFRYSYYVTCSKVSHA